MTDRADDTATTWRDLTNELTLEQVRALERIERDALGRGAPGEQVAASLLDHARYHAQLNLRDTTMFGHLPTPACARFLDHFEDEGTGSFSRRFDGTVWDIDDIRVEVIGVQHDDGTVERAVCINGEELTGGQARELAAALIEAADEIDAAAEGNAG